MRRSGLCTRCDSSTVASPAPEAVVIGTNRESFVDGGRDAPAPLMDSFAHYLSDHFPDLDHPAYQSLVEKISFIVVSAMLIGSLAAALTLIAYEL